MTTPLEEAALSGALFEPRSSSPTRSDSTSSPLNSDDELDLGPSDDEGAAAGESSRALVQPEKGPRTGIKGVVNDQRAYTAQRNVDERARAAELRQKMERTAITIPATAAAEGQEGGGVEGWREKRRMELELNRKGLREVGKEGFVHAVEKSGWVLVLIYEPEIPRCQELLHDMLELSTALAGPSAHLDTPVTLLRARATTLAFSLLPRSRDQYQDEDEDDDEEEEGEADPDVLPTILAYKDGELERNWIRVDWEIEASGQHEAGLEGLLRSEGILPKEGFDDRVPR